MTNAQLYHSLIENRVHTFEPDRRGQDFYCRECSLPASAEIHNQFTGNAAQNSQPPVQGSERQSVESAPCFTAGLHVEAYDINSRTYRRAVLMNKSAPSRAGDGWYIQWADMAELMTAWRANETDIPMPSSGGWCSVNHIRPAAAAVFPVEGKQFRSLTEAQTICPGYGSPENGFTCGREKDYDRPWCDNCQESADLDEREGENDPSLVYPHLLN